MLIALILSTIYFFLPALLANLTPVFSSRLLKKTTPISEKYFGKNKTWQGFVSGVIVAIVVFALQKLLHSAGFTSLSLIDYAHFPLTIGFLQGFGALFGDAMKSYYKRKEGIAPGESWIPFDQMDFAVGSLLILSLVYVVPAGVALIYLIAAPLLHIAANALGVLLKLREKVW